MKSYCVSECNDQCKEIIEKCQEMECFGELKTSIGKLFLNSQKSCCESNQIFCETLSNLSGGAIVGIVIGSIVGTLLIIRDWLLFSLQWKSKSKKESTQGPWY